METPRIPVRQGVAALFGPLLVLVALALATYVVPVAVNLFTWPPDCVSGYACPSAGARAVAGIAFGLTGLAASGLFAATGVGLHRYAWSDPPRWRRWIVATAAAAPAAAVLWFLAAMHYWGELGAFS